MLTITAAASDPTLLTLAEIAEATGQSASAAGLAALNARVADIIAGACGLERGGAVPLTLRLETLSEVQRLPCGSAFLKLARKPIIEVLSVIEDGDTLYEDDDFEQTGARTLLRLASNGDPGTWAEGKIVVSYRAGWATVPHALKEMAAKLATTLYAERGRDPSLGSIDIPGVISKTYRYGRPDDPFVPEEIMEGLRAGGFLMHEMVY